MSYARENLLLVRFKYHSLQVMNLIYKRELVKLELSSKINSFPGMAFICLFSLFIHPTKKREKREKERDQALF